MKANFINFIFTYNSYNYNFKKRTIELHTSSYKGVMIYFENYKTWVCLNKIKNWFYNNLQETIKKNRV